MMAAAAWALGNWRWLVPTILLAGVTAAWGVEHTWRVTLQRDAAVELAREQQKVASAKEADARLTRTLEDKHDAEVRRLWEGMNAAQTAIASAARTTSCVATPAGRAFSNGVRRFDSQAGAGSQGPAAGPGPAVPGAPASAGGVGRR